MRIVSLLPGCTETVCALGRGDQLVGRSHQCDFPPAVRQLPVCTRPALNASASSREIDGQIKSLLAQALSLFRIDTRQLKALRPDLILTQSQCGVCAISLPEVEQALGEWTGAKPRILSLAPNKLADVWSDVLKLAEALGVSRRGSELVERLNHRLESIAARTRNLPRRPSIACIEWLEPLMAAGNWVPELVESGGGLNLFGQGGQHSPWLNWENVHEHDPDIFVVMPCGFDLARTRREMSALARMPGWSELRAVRAGQVFLADGDQFFNRPGPRLVESQEILAEIIHPEIFRFGHHGAGWEKLAESAS